MEYRQEIFILIKTKKQDFFYMLNSIMLHQMLYVVVPAVVIEMKFLHGIISNFNEKVNA